MDYADIAPPDRIAFGAQRAAEWSTTVVETRSGKETTNQNWSWRRHRFDLSYAVRSVSAFDDIDQHHAMVRGRAKVFPFKDYLDFSVTRLRGTLVDKGGAPIASQLVKVYGSAPHQYARPITRPRTGTVVIWRLRAGVSTDVTSSTTIDYATGTVTVAASQRAAGDVFTWTGEFWVPCRYDNDALPALIINRQGHGELLVQCDSIQIREVQEGF